MLEHFLHTQWVELIVVVVAGFLIGLEIKAHRIKQETNKEIGSVRTFAFISLIGYVFAKLSFVFDMFIKFPCFFIFFKYCIKGEVRTCFL